MESVQKESYQTPENPLPEVRFVMEEQYTPERLAELRAPLIEYKQKELERLEQESMTPREYLGEGFEKIETFLEEEIKKYYLNLGFNEEDLIHLPVFVLKLSAKEGEHLANANTFAIEMPELDIDDNNVKILAFSDLLGHERYHASKAVFAYDKKTNSTNITSAGIKHKETGKKYRGQQPTNPEHPTAVEEAYAVLFQEDFTAKVKQLLPKESVKKYERAIRELHSEVGDKNEKKVQLIQLNQKEPGGLENEYPYAVRLVKFLEKNIPDFHRMVETVRLRGNNIKLAQVCRDTFGDREAYRKIVTTPATKEGVDALMEYLKQQLAKKQTETSN